MGCSGIKRMRMNRHDDSQRSGRLVTQPPRGLPPPPSNSLYEQQLPAPADRPQGDPARAVAVATVVAIGGAGSVHRRTGMRAARAFPGDRNGPGSPPATPPALPAIQTRCSADHLPVSRCEAGADVRRADGACMKGRARAARRAPYNTASTHNRPYCASIAEIHRKWGCKMILKEPYARAA